MSWYRKRTNGSAQCISKQEQNIMDIIFALKKSKLPQLISMSINENEKKKLNWSTSCDDRKLPWFKHNLNNIQIRKFIILQSWVVQVFTVFFRSREDNVNCLGTGNGLTEVLNENKSISWTLPYQTLLFIKLTKTVWEKMLNL